MVAYDCNEEFMQLDYKCQLYSCYTVLIRTELGIHDICIY